MLQPEEKPEKRNHNTSQPPGADAEPSILPSGSGLRLWRSLDELAGLPAFPPEAQYEFPEGADVLPATFNRREMLKLVAASAALAGLTGCTKLPTQHIVPYAGQPVFYAAAMTMGGVAFGILAQSTMGRPTKIEGNPDHPASLGGSDVFAQ